jgi:FkbM family methyltransferase
MKYLDVNGCRGSKMIEMFLRLLNKLAERARFLTPLSIKLSIQYLQKKYKTAFLENDPEVKAYKLRYLALLRQKLHPSKENFIVTAKIDGEFPIRVNICQQYCGDIFYGVGFEQDELNIVKRLVGIGDTFFDVGANIGVYTLVASRLVGEKGSIHAFEPSVDTFALLRENVELNHAKNVKLNPVAVGSEVGEVDLFINVQSALSGLGRTNRGTVLGVQKVPLWTLDDYAKRLGVSSIDFLKIDVEGFEGHVLRGAPELLSNSPNIIVMCELAKKNFEPLGFSVRDVLVWMRKIGFEAWMISNNQLKLEQVNLNDDKYPFHNFIFSRHENKRYGMLKNLE